MADQSSPSPPEPTSDELSAIVTLVKDWTISNGLAVRPPPAVVAQDLDPNGILATSAPVTLFPSPFPRVCFEQAVSIQKAYNHLYAKISQDEAFLKDIVEE
jgi:glutathione synthase